MFYTPEEIAEMMKVSPEVVILWIRTKKLGGIKVGNIWRIPGDQFEKFISEHTYGQMDEPDDLSQEQDVGEVLAAELPENLVRKLEVDKTFRGRRGKSRQGKYDDLTTYLRRRTGDECELSFEKIIEILGVGLPQSAKDWRPWWSNDLTHSQGRAWMEAGWRVSKVDVKEERVLFVRSGKTGR